MSWVENFILPGPSQLLVSVLIQYLHYTALVPSGKNVVNMSHLPLHDMMKITVDTTLISHYHVRVLLLDGGII